ncbi:hypothetical protein J2T13_003834 [Paenibacillus sp. DS2015]|uniref:hypothetical protein n=1 Tax=Paenibacillus sp. DS2015 TaxID=3373917 RepID=UPI003D23B716
MEQPNLSTDLVSMIAKLADLKDEHYLNTLAISTMLELLVDKGIFTREEMENKAAELDQFMACSPYPMA